jgi:hypothetical protein
MMWGNGSNSYPSSGGFFGRPEIDYNATPVDIPFEQRGGGPAGQGGSPYTLSSGGYFGGEQTPAAPYGPQGQNPTWGYNSTSPMQQPALAMSSAPAASTGAYESATPAFLSSAYSNNNPAMQTPYQSRAKPSFGYSSYNLPAPNRSSMFGNFGLTDNMSPLQRMYTMYGNYRSQY